MTSFIFLLSSPQSSSITKYQASFTPLCRRLSSDKSALSWFPHLLEEKSTSLFQWSCLFLLANKHISGLQRGMQADNGKDSSSSEMAAKGQRGNDQILRTWIGNTTEKQASLLWKGTPFFDRSQWIFMQCSREKLSSLLCCVLSLGWQSYCAALPSFSCGLLDVLLEELFNPLSSPWSWSWGCCSSLFTCSGLDVAQIYCDEISLLTVSKINDLSTK